MLNCRWCGNEFDELHHNQKYCKECRSKYTPVQMFAIRHPERVKKIYTKYRKNNLELCRKRTREGQIALNNKKRFGGLKYKVLERDHYTCQICNKDVSGKNMACVHHINHIKTDNIMDNLITYCKSCHSKHHYHDRKTNDNGDFCQ